MPCLRVYSLIEDTGSHALCEPACSMSRRPADRSSNGFYLRIKMLGAKTMIPSRC
jgi:hypothetical protein